MRYRLTECSDGNGNFAIANYGRCTRAEMLAEYRRYWQHELDNAQRALAKSDDDLVVETYLGKHANRNREVVK